MLHNTDASFQQDGVCWAPHVVRVVDVQRIDAHQSRPAIAQVARASFRQEGVTFAIFWGSEMLRPSRVNQRQLDPQAIPRGMVLRKSLAVCWCER